MPQIPRREQHSCLFLFFFAYQTPFLFWENVVHEGQRPTYQLVGECYVHGLVDGEGLGGGKEQDVLEAMYLSHDTTVGPAAISFAVGHRSECRLFAAH